MPQPEQAQLLTGKIAAVTGAASGIGLAVGRLLAERGALVYLADINGPAAEECAHAISEQGGLAEAVDLDVASPASWKQLVRVIETRHGRLDVLVNSAGIANSQSISEISLQEFRRVLDVNLIGVYLGTKLATPLMNRGGSIVNIASVSGIEPSPSAAAYCASKAALRMFSQVAALEFLDAETGTRVNTVTPGGVKTPMWDEQPFFQQLVEEHGGREEAFSAMSGDRLSQQFLTPEEVAKTVLYLASDDSAHLTGTEIVLGH